MCEHFPASSFWALNTDELKTDGERGRLGAAKLLLHRHHVSTLFNSQQMYANLSLFLSFSFSLAHSFCICVYCIFVPLVNICVAIFSIIDFYLLLTSNCEAQLSEKTRKDFLIAHGDGTEDGTETEAGAGAEAGAGEGAET